MRVDDARGVWLLCMPMRVDNACRQCARCVVAMHDNACRQCASCVAVGMHSNHQCVGTMREECAAVVYADVTSPNPTPVPCAVCRVPCAVCRVPCAVCRAPCAVYRVAQCVHYQHTDYVKAVVYAKDTQRLISAGFDQKVVVTHMDTGKFETVTSSTNYTIPPLFKMTPIVITPVPSPFQNGANCRDLRCGLLSDPSTFAYTTPSRIRKSNAHWIYTWFPQVINDKHTESIYSLASTPLVTMPLVTMYRRLTTSTPSPSTRWLVHPWLPCT